MSEFRSALVLRGDDWKPCAFDNIRAGDLFVLVEPSGEEVHNGCISFATSDAVPQSESGGAIQAVDLAKMTRGQCLEMVQTIRRQTLDSLADGVRSALTSSTPDAPICVGREAVEDLMVSEGMSASDAAASIGEDQT